jgi:hypothetical protein
MLPVKSESGDGCVLIKKELKRARRAIDNNLFNQPVFKITLKAHFQLPNVSGHKFKPTPRIQSKKIEYDEINDLEDLYKVLQELSHSDTKCGDFKDIYNPPPLRMLDFLGGTKQFITRSEEIETLPIEFQNISCNAIIDIGICNLNRGSSAADDERKTSIIKKRKANVALFQSSTTTTEPFTTVIDVDADDDQSCTFISTDCSPYLPLKFDFLHGRIESSTCVINGKQLVSQKVVLSTNKAGFKE